ncbi:MAG: hypothetical protein JWP69_241 [Flaviaesturariibacter sp.]|nr:hypothetical protein [Flaviaesturariibacter sp.]
MLNPPTRTLTLEELFLPLSTPTEPTVLAPGESVSDGKAVPLDDSASSTPNKFLVVLAVMLVTSILVTIAVQHNEEQKKKPISTS